MHTILVIEDAELFRSEIANCLGACGHTIVEARTASEGIDSVLKLTRMDLALIDLQLPDVNGCEAASTLREMFGPDLPVLFITAPEKDEMSLIGRADITSELPHIVAEMLRLSGHC